MTFSSGLFGLDVGFWSPSPTVAWAECEVDLMGQPMVRFHHVVADGYGKDSYGWDDLLVLRVDYVRDRLDLVTLNEREWAIEASFGISEIEDDLEDARVGEGDPQQLLQPLLDAAHTRVRAFPLKAEDIAGVDGLALIDCFSVKDELARRGLWQPRRRPDE